MQAIKKRGPKPNLDLSDRERQIMGELAKGVGVKQAAYNLGISVNTFYRHSERIRFKLGTQTTRAALAKVLQEGLI